MECHFKWNVTLKYMSPKIEFNSKWNDTQHEMLMSWKIECQSRLNVTNNRIE